MHFAGQQRPAPFGKAPGRPGARLRESQQWAVLRLRPKAAGPAASSCSTAFAECADDHPMLGTWVKKVRLVNRPSTQRPIPVGPNRADPLLAQRPPVVEKPHD